MFLHIIKTQLKKLRDEDKLLEAQRLEQRTTYDIEMLKEMGTCPGIENYSGPISGRAHGEPPATLLHYFPDDFLCMIDEAHVTVPQIGAMYEGDRSRKQSLIDFGFRLPSALDNRPLKKEEFDKKINFHCEWCDYNFICLEKRCPICGKPILDSMERCKDCAKKIKNSN